VSVEADAGTDAGTDAPTALTDRVSALLAAHPEWTALPRPEALTRAAEALLAGVLARSGDEAAARDRANALDLLAADACITWAFEAISEVPHIDELPARATAAMQRILALTGREATA
jgi:hypothetical protein